MLEEDSVLVLFVLSAFDLVEGLLDSAFGFLCCWWVYHLLCALWLFPGDLCCFFVCSFLCVLMSGRKKKAASPACSLLQPTVLFDALGSYIALTCGSLSGNFYLSRLLESN